MASNIADGKYNALPDAAAVYEKNDKLVLELRFTLCDEHGSVYDGVPRQSKRYWLTSADGAVNQKTIAQIRRWATGWDGVDPFWFVEQDGQPGGFASCGMVWVDLKTENYTASDGSVRTWQSINWVDPLEGGTGGARAMVGSGDKASIMAKYGAKFRAIAAPRAVAPAPAASTAPATRPASPSPSAPATPAANGIGAGLAGQATVWEKYRASLAPGTPDAQRDEGWFAMLDKVAPNRDQQAFTSQEWEAVAAMIPANAGFDPEDCPF